MARKRIHDLGELLEAAAESVTMALSDGDVAHEPGSWKEENEDEQLQHIRDHLDNIDEEGKDDIDEYTHLVCRTLMLYVKRQERSN